MLTHNVYDFLNVNQFENSLRKKGAYDLLGILKIIFQKSQSYENDRDNSFL